MQGACHDVTGSPAGADLVDTVARVLTATGIEPATLCLELTASMVMKDVERAVATLRDPNALGVQLAGRPDRRPLPADAITALLAGLDSRGSFYLRGTSAPG